MDKKSIVEAIIFASGEGVTLRKLADILDVSTNEIEYIIANLREKYDKSGFNIIQVGEKYTFATKPEYAEYIQHIVTPKIQKPLSAAAVEVLAIIAYKQPITRSFIEKIRGVESKFSIMKLLERDLIENVGRLEAPGNPVLYGTTDLFLKTFGFATLDDLPDLNEFAEKVLGEESYEIEGQENFITECEAVENISD